MIVPIRLKQQFCSPDTAPNPHLPTILGHFFASKQNEQHLLVPDQKPFHDQQIKKNRFLFLNHNFSATLLRINLASTIPFPGISPFCILSISTNLRNRPSKTFSYYSKACCSNFIPPYEIGHTGSLFPLEIATNELSIDSSGNLPSNKI